MGDEGLAPVTHPEPGRGQLICRFGFRDEGLIDQAGEHRLGLTSAPLAFMWFNGQLAFFGGRRHRDGLVLDPEAHHRTLPRKQRTINFRRLPYGDDPIYRPDRDRLSAPAVRRLVDQALGLQREHHATLLLAPAHLAGPVGSLGRDQDLRIAEACARVFAQEHMYEPPPGEERERRRKLFASLVVSLELLSDPSAQANLVRLYGSLDVAGYWVQILGYHERARPNDVECATAFLAALRRTTGLPVVASRPGNLAAPLIAVNFAVELGIAEGERFGFARKRDAGDDSGRVRSIYHPALLRSYRPDRDPRRDAARRAFTALGCSCGAHEYRERPDGRQTKPHTLRCRLAEALEYNSGDAFERRRRLRERLNEAAEAAEYARVDCVEEGPFLSVLTADDARGASAARRGR